MSDDPAFVGKKDKHALHGGLGYRLRAGCNSKALEAAKKSMIRIPLREGRTLHHDVRGRFGAGKVMIRMAPAGTGIDAEPGPVR